MSFSTLLVANRGEIARRIIRSAHDMGIRCVAVYVDADAQAPFVADADEAVRLSGGCVTERGSVELRHIAFGTVLGEDGRPYKTRSGSAVGLTGLLDEAVERAYQIVSENDDARSEPLLTEDDRHTVAERIGIGAIKYADLAHNRTSDYVFSYDKMLAMTGNTAAYMQYSYARVRSIFSRGDVDAESGLVGNVDCRAVDL